MTTLPPIGRGTIGPEPANQWHFSTIGKAHTPTGLGNESQFDWRVIVGRGHQSSARS